ncbi:MAG TPA: glycoside hydrolase family 2 protein [Bacteroidales bacterium]|nr:glycoside hydrolase family 2 protein [Bacteroidales bacterium]
MKLRTLIILLFAFSFSMIKAQNSETINLNADWQFSESGKNEWKTAVVPGSVQRDLIRLEKLPDPYWRTNEKLVQWVEDKNWDYRKSFQVTAEQLKHDDALLIFKGLDTYADVYLNGSKILSAENMFIAYETSVKNLLKVGENKLYIRFYSPVNHLMPAHLTSGFDYPADNDHRLPRVSVYARKAPYHFGWDWGMRMVQIGIWRPVELHFYNQARVEDYWVKQVDISQEKAVIDNQIEINLLSETAKNVEVEISYAPKRSKFITESIRKSFIINKGKNQINIPLEIENPKLWMPKDWGEQNLYSFIVTVFADNKEIDSKTVTAGLRKIEFVREDDKAPVPPQNEMGKSYYFKVNGIPIFAKGANYIPGEIINTQQDKAYYDLLFENICEANMNMVRVWGGGFYEDDYFYQLADEKGILVWQDFMFACTTYPHDRAFLDNVEKEAEYNLKRLRNNPSVVFWCGNNEVAEALKYWGWDQKYTPEVFEGFKVGYHKLFKELLPKKVAELDPEKAYVHTSPDTANWGRPEGQKLGDAHYWGVWYGRQPFEILNERVPRFMSEFGFQAFPEMKTIRSFAPSDEWYLESETMLTHQKSTTGNDAIKEYMDRYYHTPKNFEDFVYIGLVMQGRGMSLGMKAHRRNRPFCMGSLYWQLNDSWPVVSWAGIDYYGNWKAMHYHARDAFKPLTVHVYEQNGNVEFYTLSDKLQDETGLKLSIELIDFSGKRVKRINKSITAKANASEIVHTINSDSFVTEAQRKNCFILAKLSDKKGKVIGQEIHYFDVPKNLNLPETNIQTKVKQENGKITVTLSSKRLAKDVFIEFPVQGAKFTDNFFDLLPGEKRVITITSPKIKQNEKYEISVKHLRETY